MASSPLFQIDKLEAALERANIGQQASEVHGALIGLICGGIAQKTEVWLPALLSLINDDQPLPDALQQLIVELYQDSLIRLADPDFGFSPLLPEEEEPLSKRVEALSLWVQSFLTGLAIGQPKLNKASKDVKEIISDLANIAQVEFDVTEDDESETAYVELLEFTRIAALLCYAEFGPDLTTEPEQPTLH